MKVSKNEHNNGPETEAAKWKAVIPLIICSFHFFLLSEVKCSQWKGCKYVQGKTFPLLQFQIFCAMSQSLLLAECSLLLCLNCYCYITFSIVNIFWHLDPCMYLPITQALWGQPLISLFIHCLKPLSHIKVLAFDSVIVLIEKYLWKEVTNSKVDRSCLNIFITLGECSERLAARLQKHHSLKVWTWKWVNQHTALHFSITEGLTGNFDA